MTAWFRPALAWLLAALAALDKTSAFEAVCLLAILYGISYFSVPVAIITGGILGVVVTEARGYVGSGQGQRGRQQSRRSG